MSDNNIPRTATEAKDHDAHLKIVMDEMNVLMTKNLSTSIWGKLAQGNKWPDQMGETVYPTPTKDELRTLVAALLWTENLQPDLTDFLAKFPHLRPPTEPIPE